MRNGDTVYITDGSYSLEITKDGLRRTYVGFDSTIWRILQTGIRLEGQVFLGETITNDTIVQEVNNSETKRIVFTQRRFLRLNSPKQQKCEACLRVESYTDNYWTLSTVEQDVLFLLKQNCICKK